MSSASKASWAVAASVAAVEALKDQAGFFCRWNYALRFLHQNAKKKADSLSEANRMTFASSSSSVLGRKIKGDDEAERTKQSEESLWTDMYLSCWGPN